MTEKTKRFVLISDGTPQILYLTETDLDVEAISDHMQNNTPMLLTECRILRTLMIPSQDGIVAQNMVTSYGIFRGPVEIYVRPTSFVFPDQDDAVMAALQKQLKHCKENEIRNRAADSGLVMVSPGPRNNPDGLRSIPR